MFSGDLACFVTVRLACISSVLGWLVRPKILNNLDDP